MMNKNFKETTPFKITRNTPKSKDAFVCHASEDKAFVVRPLVKLLSEKLNIWLDESELLWGDSITEKINEAFKSSRFVIVVLSSSFLKKNWPQRELNAVLNIEASTGIPKILPIVVGDEEERKRIFDTYPLLNDKLHMFWPEDQQRLVNQVHQLLERDSYAVPDKLIEPIKHNIYIPNLKRIPDDRSRRKFIQEGFGIIKDHFVRGINKLTEESNGDIEGDLNDIHTAKFVCYLYEGGKEAVRCKIWQGGMWGNDQISYLSNFNSIDGDNSTNGWLSVSQEELAWETSGMEFYSSNRNEKLDHQGAASYFWKKFVEHLEQHR